MRIEGVASTSLESQIFRTAYRNFRVDPDVFSIEATRSADSIPARFRRVATSGEVTHDFQ